MLVLNKGIEQNRKFGENIKKKKSEMIPFQPRNRVADIESRRVDTVGEGGVGMN